MYQAGKQPDRKNIFWTLLNTRNLHVIYKTTNPDSSVGIGTRCRLDSRGSVPVMGIEPRPALRSR
jgi:hypothetical protein